MSIEIADLDYSYGAKQVLRKVSLSIAAGETLSVLGANGAGKTTLLNLAAGLLKVQSGSLAYNGKQFRHYDARQMALLVGYVPQFIIPAFDYSVVDYVVTGCAPQMGTFERPGSAHYRSAMEAIREMGIEQLAEKSYKALSGGERQQVSIARALCQRPAYILMDEPTSHLDYGNQVHVLKTIKHLARAGFGVVFTTHNPDQALLVGGKTAVIDREGKLITGDSGSLINEAFLSKLYGTRLCVSAFENQARKVCFAPALEDGGQNEYI